MLKSTYEWASRDLQYVDLWPDTTNCVTAEIDLRDRIPVGIDMTPDGDSWDAAAITFQASPTTVTSDFQSMYNDTNVEYAVSAAANRHIVLVPDDFLSIRYLRLRSGTAGAPVTQDTALHTIRLWLRR